MAKPIREDRDVLPPPGWQPKSAFFKAVWKKAEFNIENPRVALTCPCCGEKIAMRVSVIESSPLLD